MFLTVGRPVIRVLVLTALVLVLATEPARAQGRCMRQQTATNGLQPQLYTSQQAYALQQYALQQYALQQYALQQYALQQYTLRQLALQQVPLQAQLNALQQNGLLAAQLSGPAAADVLEAQLNALQQYVSQRQENGQLTPSQLRALRHQEKALAKQLRAAQKRSAQNQRKQARSQTPATEDR